MFNRTEQTVSGDGNIFAGGNINLTRIINNETHVILYEDDIAEVIELFGKHIDLFDDNNSYEYDGDSSEYDFSEKEVKNRLNDLSDEYFEVLKEEFLPFFYKIDEFIKNPQNKKLLATYKKVSLRLKTTIVANRSKFDKFDEVISDVSNTISREVGDRLDPLLVLVILNYMYWNCDIGRKS